MPKVCNVFFLLVNFVVVVVVVVVAVNFLYSSPFLCFVFSFVLNSLPYITLPRNNEKTKINCNMYLHVLWLHPQSNSKLSSDL